MTSADQPPPETQEFLEALHQLDGALDDLAALAGRMRERIAEIDRRLADGVPLPEVVAAEEAPLVVQLLSESAEVLQTHGARVRRSEARALHRAGMTMDEIARRFGVTRQRVSALVRHPPAGAPPT